MAEAAAPLREGGTSPAPQPEVLSNFRAAVQARKSRVESDVRMRAQRYAAAASHARSLGEEGGLEAVKKHHDFENNMLRRSRRRWTTADFEQLRVLGEGGFGTVHLVRSRGSQRLLALKQMSKEAHKRKNRRVFTERNVLAEARSTWIVELFATFQDRDYVFMAMEFGQGGDLRGHLQRREPGNGEYGRFTHDEVVFYTAELLEALDTVHQCGFVHRDVKPDNVVLTREGHLKLLDFGLCIGRADQQDLCGSPPYLAAETFQGAGTFSPASDLWALGVVAFECLYGRPLWPPPRELSGPEAFRWLKDNIIVRYDHYLRANLKSAERKGLLTSELRRIFERLICPRGNRLRADALRREPLFRGLDFKALQEAEPPIRPALDGLEDASMFPQCPDRALPSPHSGPGADPALHWSWYELDAESHHMSKPDVLIDCLRGDRDPRLSGGRASE